MMPPPVLTASSPAQFHSKIVLTRERDSASFKIISANLPPTATLTLQWQSMRAPISSPSANFAPSRAEPRPKSGDLVDNWELLLNDDAEKSFPDPRCATRGWAQDTAHAWSGKQSLVPQPNAWLICGPFDLTYARDLLTQFTLLNAIDFGVGISTDGENFSVLKWQTAIPAWSRFDVWANGWSGQPKVWVAFVASPNTWLDDVRVWRYNTPAAVCGNRDAGKKGVHLPSHEIVNGAWYPIIRAGDVQALRGLIAANANWVRLGFRQPDPHSPYSLEQEYDRMIDSLCAAGISVLGLLNQETLVRPIENSPAYRREFTENVWWYATHFKDRVTFWELWNEPNLPNLRIEPRDYAALLVDSYRFLGAAHLNAKLVFGGLGSGWHDSNEYLTQVYSSLNADHGGSRPFDIFALHLYFSDKHPLDPAIYLRAPDQLDATKGDRTIVDKFARTMRQFGDVNRRIWVTEIGWNSAKNERGAPPLAIEQATQAQYLKSSFDILSADAPTIDKIFWYQYHDVIGADGVPGFWGLFGTDKQTPKPSFCAFAAYPIACP